MAQPKKIRAKNKTTNVISWFSPEEWENLRKNKPSLFKNLEIIEAPETPQEVKDLEGVDKENVQASAEPAKKEKNQPKTENKN